MKKEIIVFANSVMRGGRCVAGKEIESKQWIRPVSRRGGELDRTQCTVSGGKDPVRPLQKIEIDVDGPYTSIKSQPDNWRIGNDKWEHIGKIPLRKIGPYLDSPDILWGTGDRVPYSEIENDNMTIEQSLYLVKVSGLQLYRPDSASKRMRASFSYKGEQYNLAFTDPRFEEHRDWPYYQEEEVLCISLAGKFASKFAPTVYHCYKIAAARI